MLSLNSNAFSVRKTCLAMLVGTLVIGCGSVQQVILPPQHKAIFSGGNQEVYDIKIINQGTVAVRLSEKLEHGESIDQGFLSGGDKQRLSFFSGSSAVFANILSDTVYLKLRVFGVSELETRWELTQ